MMMDIYLNGSRDISLSLDPVALVKLAQMLAVMNSLPVLPTLIWCLLMRTIKDVLEAAENDLIDLLNHAQLSGFLTLYIQ
jgi:hypothetical protein